MPRSEIGGFQIDRLLGRGGMADVWLAHHRLSGQTAAIKLITSQRTEDQWFRDGFRNEVRAVAGLDHPGIVRVFDAGLVQAPTAMPDGRWLSGGTPWLAMMLAEHGDLTRLPQPTRWPVLREVLLQILDALAHAHARDVIHRDLKPGNVLVRIEGDRLQLMLTDFGIAHVFDPAQPDATGGVHAAGTPAYMAPEQITGAWRDLGPWTDLYALGCLAFELATGALPYRGTSPLQIAPQHLSGPLPRVAPTTAMPPGFGDWVARLMARSPDDRYRTAADAARALSRLPTAAPSVEREARRAALRALGLGGRSGEATAVMPRPNPTADPERETAWAPTVALVLAPTAPGQPPTGSPTKSFAVGPPPMPETWYAPGPRHPLLPGVGLGLYGVRPTPFVGRDAERNTLWDTLSRVRAQRRAELVLLTGGAGVGKTALAEWLGRRAREVGAAEHLPMRFGATTGDEGLVRGLLAWFRAAGLRGAELVERLRRTLERHDPSRTEAITAVIAPSLARLMSGPEGEVSLAPTARDMALRETLAVLAHQRPLVVLLDDLHWATEGVRFLEWMLSHPLEAPVMVIATVQLAHSERSQLATFERLQARPSCQTLSLGPLDDQALAEAIEAVVGLSPGLSRRVRRHCAGQPLFAEQVIADWVEQRTLVPTEAGYDAAGDGELSWPVDLATVGLLRLERACAALPGPSAVAATALRALEVASILGEIVRRDEWHAACAALSIAVPDGLRASLGDAGLIQPVPAGWRFTHRFVGAALRRRARGAARWAPIHRACAEAISSGANPAARQARHLIEGEALEAALSALVEAARNSLEASRYDEVRAFCAERGEVVDRLELPADDVRRAQGWWHDIDALRFLGRTAEAEAEYRRFQAFPVGPEHPRVLAERARLAAHLTRDRSSARAQFDAYTDAVTLFRAAGDIRGEARALHGLGFVLMIAGRARQSIDRFIESRQVAARGGFRIDEGWALHGEALARQFNHWAGVDGPLGAAEQIFGALAFPFGRALVRTERAELARQHGALDDAERELEAATALLQLSHSRLAFYAGMVHAALDLDRGRDAAAFERVRPALEPEQFAGLPERFRDGIPLVGARAAARLGDWAAFERCLTMAEGLPSRTCLHPAARLGLEPLAERLAALGRLTDSRRVWHLAAEHWAVIDPDAATRHAARAEAIVR